MELGKAFLKKYKVNLFEKLKEDTKLREFVK